MFLLARPPRLRWVAAVVLVLAGLWADLRPDMTVEHPIARHEIEVGSEVTSGDVDMIDVPIGLFDAVELPLLAARPVAAGEPILASATSADTVTPPAGWLLVELAVPNGALPGGAVVAVVSDFESDTPSSIEGIVVATGIDDGLGTALASCAFPADQAGIVAVAAAENRISVLIGT